MPELPEVETVCRGITPIAKNASIKNIVIRTPKLRWLISKELYDLKNQTIVNIKRRAKYIILKLQKGYIIIHLGMSGTLKINKFSEELTKHDHADFILDNGYIIRYNDPRKFGCILWAYDLNNFNLFKKLGPEPLTDEFNADYLYLKSKKYKQAVKNFIMQNAIVVGVGNIYANEVLFLSKINPAMPTNKLTIPQTKQLVYNIKTVLAQAIEQGGTTLKDYQQPDGKLGYFAQQLQVYGRENLPCIVCKDLIKSVRIGQRNSFFCPTCQNLAI